MDHVESTDRSAQPAARWRRLLTRLFPFLAAALVSANATALERPVAQTGLTIPERVAAVRERLDRLNRNPNDPVTRKSLQRLAQWLNFPNFPNFPNFRNFPNFPKWFNRW